MGGTYYYSSDKAFEEFMELVNQTVPPWLFTLLNIVSIAVTILYIIACWKMFEKAGEDGWKCLIPIYSTYIIFKIVYDSGWKFLLIFVPIISWGIIIMFPVRQAQAYGKSVGFGLLNFFFPWICIWILAFGKSDYEGPIYSFL